MRVRRASRQPACQPVLRWKQDNFTLICCLIYSANPCFQASPLGQQSWLTRRGGHSGPARFPPGLGRGSWASGRFVTLPPPLPGPSWPIVSWGNASLSPDGSPAPMSQGLGLCGGLTLPTRPFGHELPQVSSAGASAGPDSPPRGRSLLCSPASCTVFPRLWRVPRSTPTRLCLGQTQDSKPFMTRTDGRMADSPTKHSTCQLPF